MIFELYLDIILHLNMLLSLCIIKCSLQQIHQQLIGKHFDCTHSLLNNILKQESQDLICCILASCHSGSSWLNDTVLQELANSSLRTSGGLRNYSCHSYTQFFNSSSTVELTSNQYEYQCTNHLIYQRLYP